MDDEDALTKACERNNALSSFEAVLESMEDIAADDKAKLAGEDERVISEADFAAQEAEDQAQEAYESRCAVRAKAEDDWVDKVVAEQEALEKEKKSEAEPAKAKCAGEPKNAAPSASVDDKHWASALLPFGMQLVRAAASGRGVAAARSFAPGDVLLRAPAVAAVPTAECAFTHCHHCLKPAEALKICSACKYARYCCVAHQRAAWPAHKAECRMLKRTRPRVPGPSVLLLARLLDLVGGASGEGGAAAGSVGGASGGGASGSDGVAEWMESLACVRSLDAHLDHMSSSQYAELASQSAMLCGLLAEVSPPDKPPPSAQLAHRLLGVLSANAHTICDGELQPIGLGLFPLAALTNHDCEPSACQSFEGARIVLRALRPLRAGELVTIAYVDLAQAGAARRAELFKGYCFMCRCSACSAQCSARGKEDEAEDRAKALAARLVRAREETLGAIDAQRWDAALSSAALCCELCEQLMPASAPAVGIERARLGKLLAHAGRLPEAVHSWRIAHRVLQVAHGSEAPLVKSLDRDLMEILVEAEMHRGQETVGGTGPLATYLRSKDDTGASNAGCSSTVLGPTPPALATPNASPRAKKPTPKARPKATALPDIS